MPAHQRNGDNFDTRVVCWGSHGRGATPIYRTINVINLQMKCYESKKRSEKNSANSAVAGFVGAINDRIPLPAGVELCSEAWLIIWHQFTRARARSDWRDMDLILLAKIVKMEADIRAAQIELYAMGMMVFTGWLLSQSISEV